jgi:hypothetical protein
MGRWEVMAEWNYVTADVLGPPPVGRTFWSVADVEERVRLAICEGGPKDGWVYDLDRMKPSDPASPPMFNAGSVTYEYRGDLARLPDGRIARVFVAADGKVE